MISHRILPILRGVFCAAPVLSCAAFKGKAKYVGDNGDSATGTPLPERLEGGAFLGDSVDRSVEMPVAATHNETAWARNRRAEFGVAC